MGVGVLDVLVVPWHACKSQETAYFLPEWALPFYCACPGTEFLSLGGGRVPLPSESSRSCPIPFKLTSIHLTFFSLKKKVR